MNPPLSFAIFHKQNQNPTLHSTLVLLPMQLTIPGKDEKYQEKDACSKIVS